jgi:hypothetical protein
MAYFSPAALLISIRDDRNRSDNSKRVLLNALKQRRCDSLFLRVVTCQEANDNIGIKKRIGHRLRRVGSGARPKLAVALLSPFLLDNPFDVLPTTSDGEATLPHHEAMPPLDNAGS